jgi:hypothetical protein
MTHAREDQEEEFTMRCGPDGQTSIDLYTETALRARRRNAYRDGLIQGLILGATAIGIAWGVLG